MQRNVFRQLGRAGRSMVALAIALLFSLEPLAAQGQQSQIDQAQQLLQQRQQSGQFGQSGPGANLPQDTLIQPARPDYYTPELPPSRLEQIMSARAGVRLRQFGYEQMGKGRAVVVPQTGAIQDDYILGPGDEIVLSLRGQENNEIRTIVDRNGQVVLPRLNPISASGRSFGSFRQDVENAVRRSFVATSAFVSVARVRQISVLVAGEVNNPGQRLVTGLSSAVDALLLSGGVKKSGSLRNVRIQRGGHEYPVDLYNVLTAGGSASSFRLADGDRLIVPPLGRTVAISGLVRQPGIYELAPGQKAMSVRTLLQLAGGQEVRGRYRLSVMRLTQDGQTQMQSLAGETGSVGDSEILFVQLGADQVTSQATLSGGTGLAGTYAISEGTKLSSVLKAPGALGNAPYTLFGIISRKDPRTLLRITTSFTPVAVLAGTEDQVLHSDDLIRVLSVTEMRLIGSTIRAFSKREDEKQLALRNPLSVISDQQDQQDQQNETNQANQSNQRRPSQQFANKSRSASDMASDQETDIRYIGNMTQRQLDRDARGVRPDDQQQYDARQAQGQAGGYPQSPSQDNTLNANYQNYGQAELNQNNQQMGPDGGPQMEDFSGQNRPFPQNPADSQNGGFRPMQPPPAANYQDQPYQANAFPTNREAPTFNTLAQQMGVNPLVLVNFFLDHRVMLDGAVRGPGSYFVGPGASLQDLVMAAGGTSNWADESGVELISTAVDTSSGRSRTQRSRLPLRQGLLASYIVKPHDELRFNQVFTDANVGGVTVQGEVRFSGTYQITRGEHLSELMASAGGLTNSAYPYGTVFLRKSVAEKERTSYIQAAKDIEDQLVVAMTRVGTDKISPDTFSSMQSFVRDLRNQTATGRVSIVADPSVLASRPELDPLLEPGDVIYIPQRPSSVSVLGQVMQPGSYPYRPNVTVGDYVAMAGGYSQTSDSSNTYIVLPDGSARKIEKSLFKFSADDLPPGSTIVVPRDVTPLDLRQTIIDISQIFSQLAISVASVAVISR